MGFRLDWTSALGLLWNRLTWYFSFLTPPKEVKNDIKSECFGVQLFGLVNEMGFFQLQNDAVDVCGVSMLDMMGIANLCILSCLVLPLFDWEYQTLAFEII